MEQCRVGVDRLLLLLLLLLLKLQLLLKLLLKVLGLLLLLSLLLLLKEALHEEGTRSVGLHDLHWVVEKQWRRLLLLLLLRSGHLTGLRKKGIQEHVACTFRREHRLSAAWKSQRRAVE